MLALQRSGACSCSGRTHQRAAVSIAAPSVRSRSSAIVVRAGPNAVEDDEELEKRLAKLKQAKGATPYGKSAAKAKAPEAPPPPPPKKKAEKVEYDWTGETVFYEGPPARGDLVTNVALGATLVWLPLTAAAVGRGLFVQYRFTDKRISVITNAPWKTERLDAAYQEVKEVRILPRGVGLWGDMVVVLRDNTKVEMRSLERFREIRDYILKRRDELAPVREADLTQEELLGEAPLAKGGKAKGFGN